MVFGCPCPSLLPAPGGPSAAPAAGVSWHWALVHFLWVCYVWLCFCCWFVPWRRYHCPAFVLWLGMGSPGFAWRRWLVSCAGLFVRAVRLVRAGFRFCAWCFGFGLAGVGASRRCRFAGLVGLRVAGASFCGQGGAACRFFLPCSFGGFARFAFAFFIGGFGYLVCLAWWRWPVRGRRRWCGIRLCFVFIVNILF